jgi:hypothetical protein
MGVSSRCANVSLQCLTVGAATIIAFSAIGCREAPSTPNGVITGLFEPLTNVSPGQVSGALSGGRMTSVVIDPANPLNVFASAQTGGIYASTDGGSTWASNFAAGGGMGPYGHGFEGTGVTNFIDLAISPDGATLLAMVNDDGRVDLNQSLGGIWQSTNGGVTFTHTGRTGARISGLTGAGGKVGKIVFAPTTPGLVYATMGWFLGVSMDSGADWKWSFPIPNDTHSELEGLDVNFFPAGVVDPLGRIVPAGGRNEVAFCYQSSSDPARTVLFLDPLDGTSFKTAPIPTDHSGDGCTVVFDPSNALRAFVGTGGNGSAQSGLSEIDNIFVPVFGGQLARLTTFTNLAPPPSNQPNGRATFVQVHSWGPGSGPRLYFHNTQQIVYEDCDQKNGCPPGPPNPPSCGNRKTTDPPTPWGCLTPLHTDATRLAFDPGRPESPCPMLLSDDGGIETSPNCGQTWSRAVTGIHAIEEWQASFAGQGATTTAVVALQDNSGYFSADQGQTWAATQSIGDGNMTDALRHDPTRFVVKGNAGLPIWAYQNVLPPSPSPQIAGFATGGQGPQLPVNMNPTIAVPGPISFAFGVYARFTSTGNVAIPTYDAGNHIQLFNYNLINNTLGATGLASPAITQTAPGITWGLGSRPNQVSVGGTEGTAGTRIYMVIPEQICFPAPVDGGIGVAQLCLNEFQLWTAPVSPAGAWQTAAGLVNPIAVWADPTNPSHAYALDYPIGHVTAMVTHDGVLFQPDPALTTLLTQGGTFGVGLFGNNEPSMTSVSFDPVRPRVAVGTKHNGILVTNNANDTNPAWSSVHTFPEPNAGITQVYFDDQAGPTDDAIVAGWGQGVWTTNLKVPTLKTTGGLGGGQVTATLQAPCFNPLCTFGEPVPGVQLNVVVIDRNILASLPPAGYPISPDGLDDPAGNSVAVSPDTPGTLSPAVFQPPPAPPNPVVMQFTTPNVTNSLGQITFALPMLPAGSYSVQLGSTDSSSTGGVATQVNYNCTGPECHLAASCAPTCPRHAACSANADCVSNNCGTDGFCDQPTCEPDCATGAACGENGDCQSNVCFGNVCQMPACAPNCPRHAACAENIDCLSRVCADDGHCHQPACEPTCATGAACGENGDCASQVCVNGTCQ